MHQSIPAATCPPPPPPPTPRPDPLALAFFLPWMANSWTWGWGLLNCQIPQGGDEKGGQMPSPRSTLQHDFKHFNVQFFVSVNVFLCNSARILIKTSRHDDMHHYIF